MRRTQIAALVVAIASLSAAAVSYATSRSDDRRPSAALDITSDPPTSPAEDADGPPVIPPNSSGTFLAGLPASRFPRPTPADIPRLTADPDSRRLYEQILGCFPAEANEFYELFEHAPCYEEFVIAAANSYEPRDLLNAVKALVAKRPDVITACHNGGHSAAKTLTMRLWDPTASYETQLDQMRSIMNEADDLCQNGYVHGFYDAIGLKSPNTESFKAAAEVCYEVASMSVDCGHGLGHSAWYSTKDFKKAAEICGVLKGDFKYRCDDGVIMYLPDYWSTDSSAWTADPRLDGFNADKYFKDAVEVCSWWPQSRVGDPEPLKGCWIGIVAGVLWRPITTLLDYGNYEDIAVEAKSLLRRAEAACRSFEPAGEEYCIKEWPGMVLYVAQNDPENVKDLCSAMVKYATRCTEESLAQLKSLIELDSSNAYIFDNNQTASTVKNP
jgi:hypothetical protein